MATRFEGAIFDIDGVLVDSPHEQAWRDSLRDLMEGEWRDIRERTKWFPDAFTRQIYEMEASGKSRIAGARALLEHFDVLDDGDESRVMQYAHRKQAMVVRLIESGAFTAFADGLRFVVWAKDVGIRLAAASSSKNASRLMQKIRLDAYATEHGIASASVQPDRTLLDVFDIDVSGRDFSRGKPFPDMFLTAAHDLGVEPAAAVVLEDAAAGVAAAKAGTMPAVGIARAGDAALLAEAGADIVVTNLDELDRSAFVEGRLERVVSR
jgi:beta-phosphoglucomutase-like phosphatase (HAD superfamily)